MKVAIGYHIIDGISKKKSPVSSISEALLKNWHEVVFDLTTKDVDLILIIDPRSKLKISLLVHEILKYIEKINPNTVVVHRINECDERKNTRLLNFKLRTATIS